jgi:hypothetical protein
MFRRNPRTTQPLLLSDLHTLPAAHRERLEQSWAATFRREIFERLDEQPFAVLYSPVDSRPNVPVNVLVGLETLKAGFGWSDAELHDAFTFNLQVRYALGYENVGEGDFDLRTLYYFRRRLSDYQQARGQSLLAQAFAQITDAQIDAFHLKTQRQRMDSTQIASNIQRFSRLQLLVEIAQRVYRMLDETEQAQYAERFAPYVRGTSGQFIYHLTGETTTPQLQALGELFQTLLHDLSPKYVEDETYRLLARVFAEHFQPQANADPGEAVTPRVGNAISPNSAQSPDDVEATYRSKRGEGYVGYVANLTETCDADNDFQLITAVQVAPNTTDDTTLLCEVLPDLVARTDLDTLYTDGGFGGPTVDADLRTHEVEQIQTAFRGLAPDPDRTSLAEFDVTPATPDRPAQVICPQGQLAEWQPGRKPERFVAHFSCPPDCPLRDQCPTAPRQTDARRSLHVSQAQLDLAQRRRLARAAHAEPGNPRAAVESTVAAVKRPFPADHLPVRGLRRVTHLIIGSALMVNLRRIHRHLTEQNQKKPVTDQPPASVPTGPTPLMAFFVALRRCVAPRQRHSNALGI